MKSEITCPNCKKGKISLYEIFRRKSDEAVCSKCEAVATFSNTGKMIEIKTKEEYEKSICPHCNERLEQRRNSGLFYLYY